jgi:dTDP-4-amino-4,6-dideoxygalactose transaminase
MSEQKIPVLDLKPQYNSLKSEIQAAINRVLESGDFILGQDVTLLEQEVANFLGVKYAIAVNSGTDALMIGLRSLGIGPGDEVITSPFSFFATAESISNVGAKPIFADVNPDSFNLCPRSLVEHITPRTKAILPVHLYGQPADMGQILEIAARHHLAVVEDCAQSFGAQYVSDFPALSQGWSASDAPAPDQNELRGRHTGTLGQIGAFSFYPTKNLGAYGDGGMIVTDQDALAESARMLRVHGEKRRYHNLMLGYNSRLDTLQAAILRVKLPHIQAWSQARRCVAQTYNEHLADIPGLVTPQLTAGHVFHQYTLRIVNGQRDRVHQDLAAQGITTMIYYPVPQDQLPVYKGQYPPNPNSDQLAQEVLSLPIWPEIDVETLQRVVDALKLSLARTD